MELPKTFAEIWAKILGLISEFREEKRLNEEFRREIRQQMQENSSKTNKKRPNPKRQRKPDSEESISKKRKKRAEQFYIPNQIPREIKQKIAERLRDFPFASGLSIFYSPWRCKTLACWDDKHGNTQTVEIGKGDWKWRHGKELSRLIKDFT